MRKIIMLFFICLSCTAHADIYVDQTKSGNIEYTDIPLVNSKKIEAPSVNSVKGTKEGASSSALTATSSSLVITQSGESGDKTSAVTVSNNATYKALNIITPKPEEIIQNQPVVSVEMKVDPRLHAGDTVQIMLDGKAVGTPTGTMYQEIQHVNPGTHTLYATIINTQKQVVQQSESITFHLEKSRI